MRSYNPTEAPPMISIHSDGFISLNAPFFSYHGFYLSALISSKVPFSKQNMDDFLFSKFDIGAFKGDDQK